MNIRWNCTFCGQSLWIPESGFGIAIRCPSCSHRLTSPLGTAAHDTHVDSTTADLVASYRWLVVPIGSMLLGFAAAAAWYYRGG